MPRKSPTRITPEMIERIKQLSATHFQCDIGSALGIGQGTVGRIQARHGIPHMGRNAASVLSRIRNRERTRGGPKGDYSPEWRAHRSALMRANRTDPAFEAKRLRGVELRHAARRAAANEQLRQLECEIPKWVPPALTDQFRDLYHRVGEFEAARWARNTKRSWRTIYGHSTRGAE